jgi:peptide/nickel transport system permease protein
MSAENSVARLNVDRGETIRTKSLLEKALYRIRRDPITLIALAILLLLTLLSVFAPLISEHILHVDHLKTNLSNNYAPIGSPGHILGTDGAGRDHLARLLYGGQVSLAIGFFAAVLSLGIGITIGAISGYYGGAFDDLIIWFITTLNSVPQLFLLLMINALLSPGPVSLILVLSFLGWTGTARLVRGETISIKEREYAIAARALGASNLRIIFQHIVPNIFSLLIISLAGAIGGLILTESGLSFLGFGIKPPVPSWGNMLSSGLDLLRRAPHLVIAPGLLIMTTVLCLYIIGDGLRDAFDPRIEDKVKAEKKDKKAKEDE